MLKNLLALVLLLITVPVLGGQVEKKSENPEEDLMLQKRVLRMDIGGLETEAEKLDKSLAQARAKVAIADALWSLDKAQSEKLLIEAYKLTFPSEEDRVELRNRPIGADPKEPTPVELHRDRIQTLILDVARRDKTVANTLLQLGKEELGRTQEIAEYSKLTSWAIDADDLDAAGDYALRALEADPTQIAAGFNLLNIAAKDREKADKLIMNYIERLRAMPLSSSNASRVYLSLRVSVFPDPFLDPARRKIAQAKPEVIRAYLSFVIDSLTQLEQREPGSAASLRFQLVSIWLPLQQYAPDLISQFMQLEALSRTANQSIGLPTLSDGERNKANYEERVSKAYKSPTQENVEAALNSAIGREDFAEARKLIERLPPGTARSEKLEDLNWREAISLIKKDNTIEAEQLARQLNKPESILRVYPALINRCAIKKDTQCAFSLVIDAIKRLKRSEDKPRLLRALAEMAVAIAQADQNLSFEVLDELVYAANHTRLDTESGQIGFNTEPFTILASKHEERALQAARNLKDRFQRVVVLAAIYGRKAESLVKATTKGK